MQSYEDWNKIDEEEEEELQDFGYLEGKRDVILFCVDCSPSMLELYDDPNYEDTKTCHLYTALEAAMQIEKKKVIVGPNDLVGILMFNTTRRPDHTQVQGSEIKKNTFLYQPISPLGAPLVRELMQLLEAARENPNELRRTFPPLVDKRVPMGDVFTSCNWVLRDGSPKVATKRVFLITDEDNPHAGTGSKQLMTSARTTLIDLIQAGVTVEPFFVSTESKPFDVTKFYSSILLRNTFAEDDDAGADLSVLPESISISRVEDLLAQMRFHEVPKRAQYTVPFHLGNGLTIGVKGYALVSEQKKGTYRYFVDLGDRMEVVAPKTVYVDEEQEAEIEKTRLLFGSDAPPGNEGEAEEDSLTAVRLCKAGKRPFYTAEQVRSFRTLGLEPGIRLLGIKDRDELAFEDNIKHSYFIYPDELKYSGSKRTFAALLNSMVTKNKIALVLALTRRNSSPTFCALLPQEEQMDEGGWTEPAGFHMIPIPFADDIRGAPIDEGYRTSDDLKQAARAWIDKLSVKNGNYPPDSFPNPALAFHNAQLEASAFRDQYDPDTFEDLTLPKYEMMHKRAGQLMKEWKDLVAQDKSADIVVATTGSKRPATEYISAVSESEIRDRYEAGELNKLRVDQLKDFLKGKGLAVSGKKADLMERVETWLLSH